MVPPFVVENLFVRCAARTAQRSTGARGAHGRPSHVHAHAPLLVSITEAAGLLAIEPDTARKWIGTGRFPVPTYKLGRRRMIRYDELRAYVLSLSPSTTPCGGATPCGRRVGRARGRPRNGG